MTLAQGLENAEFSTSPRRVRPTKLHENSSKVEFPSEFPNLRCPTCNAPELDPEDGQRLIADYDDGLTHLGRVGKHDFSKYSPVPSRHRQDWERHCGIKPGDPLRHCHNCGEIFSPLTAKHKYDPEGNQIRESTYDCPYCKSFMSAREYGNAKCESCGRRLEDYPGYPERRPISVGSLREAGKGKPCPNCGSYEHDGFLPTDFESVHCSKCGKCYEPGNGPMPDDHSDTKYKIDMSGGRDKQTEGRFLTMADAREAFNQAWKASGIPTKEAFIRHEIVQQERDFVRMTGKMDSHSRRIIYGESLTEEADAQAGVADRQNDYDPNSPEPRFLQMAKAELMRRRDLKCRDCGYVGLPSPGDANCPECGGLMDAPDSQVTSAAATADQIRANIRQQVLDKQQGLKRPGAADESVHASVPSHQHDIHLTDLVNHYGFKANGDHYVASGDSDNRLYVNAHGRWIHLHHGVRHEGHGHKALAAHLQRF